MLTNRLRDNCRGTTLSLGGIELQEYYITTGTFVNTFLKNFWTEKQLKVENGKLKVKAFSKCHLKMNLK